MGGWLSRHAPQLTRKKRVCIVGGGAAGELLLQFEEQRAVKSSCAALSVLFDTPGMACAWSLSRFTERYEVEVWEALPHPGGVASTCGIAGGECRKGPEHRGSCSP